MPNLIQYHARWQTVFNMARLAICSRFSLSLETLNQVQHDIWYVRFGDSEISVVTDSR